MPKTPGSSPAYFSGSSSGLDPYRWLGVAAAVSFVFVTLWFVARGSFVHAGGRAFTLFDDAMISLRYAYNFVHTGLIEWSHSSGRVEGLTNLGWMLVMALLLKVTNLSMAPLAVSLVSALLLMAGLVVLGSGSSKFSALPFGMRLVALAGSFSLVAWAVRGFEVSLIFLLIASLYVVSTSKSDGPFQWLATFALVFLGVATRDDFAVFCFLYASALLLAKLCLPRWIYSPWSVPGVLAASALLSFAMKAMFRYIYFAGIFPNTYYLKLFGHDRIAVVTRGLMALYGNALGIFAPLILILLLFFFASKISWFHSLQLPQELDSHLIVISLLSYSVLVGGDAWEWTGLANRFICTGLPFILLNFLQFVEVFAASPGGEAFLSRKGRLDILPLYVLLLPAFLGLGFYYNALASQLSGKVAALSGFFPINAFWEWALVGVCLLILPSLLRRLMTGHRQAGIGPAPSFLAVGVAVLLLTQSFTLIARAELRDGGNLLHVVDDSREGRLSLESREVIPAGSRVVSFWAGTFPYFRPDVDFVDPLGKMDPWIAKSKPRWAFYPGHTKWNWGYTLSHYKPDYVRGDLAKLRVAGRWTDSTPEWKNYIQIRDGLLRRKAD